MLGLYYLKKNRQKPHPFLKELKLSYVEIDNKKLKCTTDGNSSDQNKCYRSKLKPRELAGVLSK